jgi:hypothetical protein
VSVLRQVLTEIRTARGGTSLNDVARRVGVSRDEVDAMVDYWVRRGRLSVEEMGGGCPSAGCKSCASGDGSEPGCGRSGPAGPVLIAVSVRPRTDAQP